MTDAINVEVADENQDAQDFQEDLGLAHTIVRMCELNSEQRDKDSATLDSLVQRDDKVVSSAEFGTLMGLHMRALVASSFRQEEIMEKTMLIAAANAGLPIGMAMRESGKDQDENPGEEAYREHEDIRPL